MTRVENMKHFSNLFYSYIPHNFGRNRPPQINSEIMLRREIELLESLSDMRLTEEIMKEGMKSRNGNNVHPLDQQFTGLGMAEVAPLDPKSEEFKELANYLCKSKGDSHSLTYKVEDIFRIERAGEFDRISSSGFANAKNSDRRLLWHGSRTTNYGGILSKGLRIAPPEAPPSGYMFGKGIYLADMSSKSANYCFADHSGKTGLLLLCEAELGKPMLELTAGDYMAGQLASEAGAMTTWGKGMTAPLAWKDAGCVHKSLKGVSMVSRKVYSFSFRIVGGY
jgi:poly [ADP-ribose] polymerase 2/3/4